MPPAARGSRGRATRSGGQGACFPAALAQSGGNGGGGAPLFARASSRAQIAARATCGKGLARVAAANRFLGAWARVGKKKERDTSPLLQLFNQLFESIPN